MRLFFYYYIKNCSEGAYFRIGDRRDAGACLWCSCRIITRLRWPTIGLLISHLICAVETLNEPVCRSTLLTQRQP